MSLNLSTCLKFYKRKDIQQAIVEHARNKEIGMRYNDKFGKRPDVLTYPKDILELALNGVTSFHCSEELWHNPLSISSDLPKKELEQYRSGWDLVLDIDCAFVEYSKICAHLIIQFLDYCDLKDHSIKFSGNKGFHIGIPFEAFPKSIGSTPTKTLFPDAARKIAFYIKENIKQQLAKNILQHEKNNIAVIKDKVNLPMEDLLYYTKNELGDEIAHLSVEKFLEIDTILISSRHLYRMPYSLHEKSGLVSLPIDPQTILQFEKPQASPENVSPLTEQSPIFMNRNVSGETARRLLIQALDYELKMPSETLLSPTNPNQQYEELTIQSPIKEDFFPPCITRLLNGVEDGKKRSIFILINFLGKLGWNKQDIEQYIHKWNTEKNTPPLREVYIKSQLHHFTPNERLPPNCSNDGYYKSLNFCHPDAFCRKIKNPANYSLLRWKIHLEQQQDEEEKSSRKRKKKDESNDQTKNLK